MHVANQLSSTRYDNLSKMTSRSTRFNPENMPKEEVTNFDQNAILDRYHRFQYDQYRSLTQINMSDPLKQKLFGFSAGLCFTNNYNPEDLVILNHPIKGRTVMSKSKYSNLEKEKIREINIKAKSYSNDSDLKQDSSEERMQDISSIQSVNKADTIFRDTHNLGNSELRLNVQTT